MENHSTIYISQIGDYNIIDNFESLFYKDVLNINDIKNYIKRYKHKGFGLDDDASLLLECYNKKRLDIFQLLLKTYRYDNITGKTYRIDDRYDKHCNENNIDYIFYDALVNNHIDFVDLLLHYCGKHLPLYDARKDIINQKMQQAMHIKDTKTFKHFNAVIQNNFNTVDPMKF